MSKDFTVSAFKHQILSMMRFLAFKNGDVVWISGTDLRPFESVYCNTDGSLYGLYGGNRIPMANDLERFYKRAHVRLTEMSLKRIFELSKLWDTRDLSILLKKQYQIAFVDLQ